MSSHFNESGEARMVDVGEKPSSRRIAVAGGSVKMSPASLAKFRDGTLPKGDAFAVARVAGIMAAKKTGDWIPLCHPMPLESVEISFSFLEDRIAVEATAKTTAKTGVEMEALSAVCATCLALYDMGKSIDRGMQIGEVRLLRKSGGRSGEYVAPTEVSR